jgi:hypothetical protein
MVRYQPGYGWLLRKGRSPRVYRCGNDRFELADLSCRRISVTSMLSRTGDAAGYSVSGNAGNILSSRGFDSRICVGVHVVCPPLKQSIGNCGLFETERYAAVIVA